MKLQSPPPLWLPALLHLAHGMVAGGVGYMLAYSAVLYNTAAPGTPAAIAYLAAAMGLAMFEISFLAYIWMRRRKLRRLWRDARRALETEKYEEAEAPLLELLHFSTYRISPQPVLFALGACAEGRGNQRDALTLYKRCGDYEPALRAIGMLQLERGLHESAADAFRALLARRKDDLLSTVLLALALFRGGHADATGRILRQALEKQPKSELLAQNLSRVEKGEEPTLLVQRKPK